MKRFIFTIIVLLLSVSITSVFAQNGPDDLGIDNEVKQLNQVEKPQNQFAGNIAPAENVTQEGFMVKRGERPPIDIQAMPEDAYEKGILKIKLNESLTTQLDDIPVHLNEKGSVVFNISGIDQLNEQYSPTAFNKLFGDEAPTSKFFDRHRAWGFHLWYTLYFDEKTDIKELVMAYEQLDEVLIAEPQYKTQLHSSDPISNQNKTDNNSGPPPLDWTPNDPSLNLQWHYHNTGQNSGTVDADIDLIEAWNIETGNSNVIVSVHDMGVQTNHPDLSGNMWVNTGEIPGNGIDDDSNGYIDDINGWDFYNNNGSIEAGYHGTHVAGTVAAESNNGIGVAGVAGGSGSNDGVRIMTCMVYHPTIGGGVGHHLAPVYAADNGASIEQNSWGYTYANSYDQVVLDAIDYFNANGGGAALTGGITIYSAGNHNAEGLYYPGCYSGTFSVAATNNQDIRSYYSTYGTWVDVSAPGGETNVLAARGVYSTYTTSTYNYLQGTSMACPHVSGTAGLIISMAYGQLTAGEVADILRNTTDNIDALNPTYLGKLGTGRINAYQALLETQTYLVTPGTLMPIPAQTSAFTGNVRGYWFTAPTDFIVTGLRVPVDIAGDQTIEIIRFNSGPPPEFSGTTNDFVSLGRWVSVAGSGFITCYIPVSNGDHIGILGCRGTTTSYGSPNNYVTSIGGNAVTLVRLGMQYPLPTNVAQDIWQESTGTAFGRVEMYYELPPGIWQGDEGYFWNTAGNWSNGVVPDASTNVTIPAGTPYDCWVSTADGFCNNITVESGALLRIYDEVLTVSGDMYIHGLLKMEEWSGTPGELHVGDDIVWESGSSAQILSNSLNMFISGDWNFNAGANVQLTQGYVTFEGTVNSWIRSYDPDCYFNHIRNEKTGTYGLAVSELSSEDIYINGNIYNYSGNLFRFRSDHSIILNGFFNNMGGHFEGQFGTLVFDGWPGSTTLKPNIGDYLNNVTFSTSAPVVLDNTYSNLLTINGDLLIEAGGIEANNFTIEVAGTWTNTVGTGGFVEGTSTVRFIKPDAGVQMINSTEHFNILECATDPSTGIRPSGGTNVSCNVYDWTSGSISTVGSTFTANDLADNAVQGEYYLHSGAINLINTGGWVDLKGDLHIYDGTMTVTGTLSEWPYAEDASIEMSGGILDFTDCGIGIIEGFTLTSNITGGTIRTAYGFYGNRADFTPTAGTFEFYGPSPANISQSNGCTLYKVIVDKEAVKNTGLVLPNYPILQEERVDITKGDGSKANDILLISDFVISSNLIINSGELVLNGYELTTGSTIDVYGTLTMNNAADILNPGGWLTFWGGATGNLSNGNIYSTSWVIPRAGCSFTGSVNNTITFIGFSGGGPSNFEPTATYGNIIINKNPGNIAYVDGIATEPVILNGNCTVNPDNNFQIQGNTFVVHGLLTDNSSSSISTVYAKKDEGKGVPANNSTGSTSNGAKGGVMEIDNTFTLNGLLDVGDGDVLMHGGFSIASTGILNIDGGSVICDAPNGTDIWYYINGSLNMTSGLFEISNNSLNFGSTSTNAISGGTIRVGAFYANNAGTFLPTGGIVETIGSIGENAIYCSNGNYFYDFIINRQPGYPAYLQNETIIQNDFTINSGYLISNSLNMFVGGNWTNNVGPSGFVPGTGTVIFTSSGDVSLISVGGGNFYNLTVDKPVVGDFVGLQDDLDIAGTTTINSGALYSYDNVISTNGNVAINSAGFLYMMPNGVLELADAMSLNVNSGGYFYAVGSAGNMATVTHNSSGYYGFNIFSGGWIGAQYANFEFMNGNGIYVREGAIVHPSYTFNYCRFLNGAPAPSALLALNSDNIFTSTGAYFENTLGTTGYNVWHYYPTGHVTFHDASGDFAGEAFDYDTYDLVDWTYTSRTLDLTVFLEGPYNSSTNKMDLGINSILPLDQPFDTPPLSNASPDWYYTGPESVGAIPNPFIVDWILVQLRDATSVAAALPGTAIFTQAAFVLNTGEIVDLDGVSPLTFTGSISNNLYAVVWTRNHLGVISANPLVDAGGLYTYDFSSGSGQAYGGTSAQHQLSTSPVIWGVIPGDANATGLVAIGDKTNVWWLQAGIKGYIESDYNFDGEADNQDKNDFWFPNMGDSSFIPE